MPQLSVIVPVYNEAKTIRQILEKINAVNIDKEIIVVDNASCDGTHNVLREIKLNNLKIIYHIRNLGKGASCLDGLANASGEFVIIQDADLEYEPNDYLKLLEPLKQDRADIVLGARFLKGHHGLFMHRLGNRLLTRLLNLLFRSHLNDFATCYKLARRSTWDSLHLKATGFNIDVEIVCNALKRKKRLLEIPIAYYPRTYKEGKKIRWKDGLWAMFYIFKYWIRS